MLLNNIHHKKLLNKAWNILRTNNTVYYIKYLFEESEYFVLVTDLRLVWFELGDYKRIQQNAQVPNIDIETETEAIAVLVRVKTLFLENMSRLRVNQDNSKVLQLDCYSQQNSKINWFSWIFNCDLLDSQGMPGYKTGPQVIFEHFIQPSQAITNHFTETISDDNQLKLKMDYMFSTIALNYMSNLINQSSDTVAPVIQKSVMIQPSPSPPSEPEHIMTEEELELKRKQDLQRLAQEERQRNPSLNKKRRRF